MVFVPLICHFKKYVFLHRNFMNYCVNNCVSYRLQSLLSAYGVKYHGISNQCGQAENVKADAGGDGKRVEGRFDP